MEKANIAITKLKDINGFTPYVVVAFINAFVDLGHKIVIQNTVFKIYDGQTQIILTAIVNALILLPFIVLFSPAGYLSDKYPKNRIMIITAWFDVFCTCLITLFYYLGFFWAAYFMTFLLGILAAIYSPAKYGYIKELVGKEKIASANGVVQACTTTAILAGIFVYSFMFEGALAGEAYTSKSELLKIIAPIGWTLVGVSVLELLLVYRLPQKLETDMELKFNMRDYTSGTYLKENVRAILKNEIIFLSIIGLSVFWAISQVVLAAFPAYAKETLGVTNTIVIQGMLACAGFGIMFGSLYAAKVSKTHIETGLIPLGALGITVALLVLPGLKSVALQIVNFLFWGVMGGMMIIPLNALIQFHAREHESGRVLAGNNFFQNIAMLSFLGLTVLFSLLGLSARGLFQILMVVALAGTAYTIYKLPQSLIKYINSLIIGHKYRLHVIGLNNVPERGGVLMLGNHISWIDWAIVQLATPRHIHFVMIRNIYERWYLKWFLDIFEVIPISGAASRSALEKIKEYLDRNEVVCLFPEGSISRTGHLGEFQRGYEKAAEGANAVIVPFYLRGLWGSWFSRSSEKLKSLRTTGTRKDIIVAFGNALPITCKAEELKRRIFDLSIDSWEMYTRTLSPLPWEWIVTARRNANELAVADALGDPLTSTHLLVAVLCLARCIGKDSTEQNIGLLLPPGSAGTIANMAVLMRGRTVVNLNYTATKEALVASVKNASIKNIYTSRKFIEKLAQKGMDPTAVFTMARIHYLEDVIQGIPPYYKLATLIMARLLPVWSLQWIFCKRVDIESPAAILFSSGSEGVPKGVMLSHRNIMSNLKQVSDVLNVDDQDIIMGTLPLFHAFGLTVTTLMPLIEGIPIICHPDPTDTVNIAKAIARYRATILVGTATFLRLYIKNTRIHPLMLESLRLIVAGAEKLTREIREAFKLKFNKDIYEGYGATETTPVASCNIPDCIDVNYWQVQTGNRIGTVGMPLPGSSFRIIDPVTMEELPTGQDGLILIGGTQIMLGYLNDPDKTRQVIMELEGRRWYKTGDKGHLDADGFLTIVDRYSRFAKLGGEMISLTVVEGQVRDVLQQPELELVAVNVPDEKKGEQIVLLVAGHVDYDSVKTAMLAEKCNPFMIPSLLINTEAVPKLGSGKTDFNAAKALVLQKLSEQGN
jgi:acyl-[acyl-carrier-protein]-phospholipid O-acyltransferase/long-chain-fatty-acid--[acyl-carrier-protein] ligase